MCGLAGILRQAEGSDESLEFAREVTDQLVGTIEERGTDATGIAVHTGDQDAFVWKVASKASVVRASEPWAAILDQRITGATTAIQLHTRRASHDNARRDDCAHPFHIGDVVGCHNGIISNWREIEANLVKNKQIDAADLQWKVDSEAIFALLDVNDDPLVALEQLQGYFALSWTKGEYLYLARTQHGVLATAWVPDMKMFVWNSLGSNIARVLKKNGFKPKDYTLRELPPNQITRINMARFAAGQPAQKTLETARPWGTSTISRASAERMTGSIHSKQFVRYAPIEERPLVSLRDLQDRIETLEYQVRELRAEQDAVNVRIDLSLDGI